MELGYAINQRRLAELNQIIQIIEHTQNNQIVEHDEAKGLLDILSNYTKSFILLNQYDSHTLPFDVLEEKIVYEIEYDEAIAAIALLKQQLIAQKEATELFAKQKDQSFSGILKSITQTFGGTYLYPSIEEQAAHLFCYQKPSFLRRQ